MSSLKWNKIVDFYNEYRLKPENEIQNLWEQLFADAELFGYSKMYGEIEPHRSIQIGSSCRVIPDIIIKKNEKDLFIVELKQSSLDCGDKQLLSYLKLLQQINIGILICNKLYIYNFDINKKDVEQTKLAIDFTYDNPYGIKFVELFEKRNFNIDAIKEFIDNNAKFKNNALEIKNTINKSFVLNLVREYFLKNYTEKEFEEATKDLELEINYKDNKVLSLNTFDNKDETNERLIYSNEKLGKSVIFKRLGLRHGTYAAKNKGSNRYWANPNIEYLYEEWNLVLEDYVNHKFYHFIIPANSISQNLIKLRKDNPNQIDLQIIYNDINFTDSKSGISFVKWLVRTENY